MIKNGKRIYGADNTKNWHIHPFDKGESFVADTSALERQIDRMVYKLYDLTPEEIAIVEGKEVKHQS